MKAISNVLLDNQLLKGLSAKSLNILSECAGNVTFQENQLIFSPQQPADCFYILRSGEVALVVPYEHGVIEVQKLHKGDILGWSWMLSPYQWVLQARALSRTETVKIDALRLRNLFEVNPEFERELLKHLMPVVIQRLNALQLQLVDVYKAKSE